MTRVTLSIIALFSAALLAGLARAVRACHDRGLDRWIGVSLRQSYRNRPDPPAGPVHLLLCIADHFEPAAGGASSERALARVRRWTDEYPRLFSSLQDSDGRAPRHTFFYPMESYEPAHLDLLAGLCRNGFGEVEVHLHHEGDTAEKLRGRLLEYTHLIAERHSLLGRRRQEGSITYGFIHGDWALNNSGPNGRNCGVNNELEILRETGCYADFTLPSAPSRTQTRKINSIYYAATDLHRPRAHDTGTDVGAAPVAPNSLMLIQGPLRLNWDRRIWGLIPTIENGCIQAGQAPCMKRLESWLRAGVQVASRPDWFFVKLHTHGAPEKNQSVLLGEPMLRFHKELAARAAHDPDFYFHYVTAREMFNLVRAAEAAWDGSVAEARDFEIVGGFGASARTDREEVALGH